MSLVRLLARPMLASVFVVEGARAVRDPEDRATRAKPVADRLVPLLERYVPQAPTETRTLVRINGAVQLGAGLALASGRAPRLAATLLAASEAASTAAQHRFWEVNDVEERRRERREFLAGVALCGGLLIAAVDTEGRPGIPWRARRAAKDARRAARTARREARLATRTARAEVGRQASSLMH
ncbi:MAG TPA: DoxX family membrane protein [Jiangellales bacterium]|nr:DoxX family membrane protein [Jiangellales bacterium]